MTLFIPNPNENLLPYDGTLLDFGVILANPQSLYELILQASAWQPNVVTLFGKTYVTTRQVVWMGDPNASYHYSGYTHNSKPWSEAVFHVKQIIENLLVSHGMAVQFNACLLNYYPTGDDGMGYHADNERELGEYPVIASLSLGASRKFVFKHRVTKEKVEIPLQAGQLIVMAGTTQTYWVHSLPKTKKVKEGRINLTFRMIH